MSNNIKKVVSVAAAFAIVAIMTFGQTNTASAAGNCVNYVYSKGISGRCVKLVQQLANWQMPSGNASLEEDEQFGPKTKAGIMAIQKDRGLKADGIVGPNTWRALCNPQKGGQVTTIFVDAGCEKYWLIGK